MKYSSFKEVVGSSLHTWRDITDCMRDEMNREIRKEIMKELNKPLPPTKDLEIEQILQEELRKYEHDKAEFEANPLNWTNNKRRRFRLPTLRGSFNKNRKTKFHSFKPTPRIFFALEAAIEEILPQRLEYNFKQFVDVKDINFGEPYISINPDTIADLNNRKMDNYDTKEAFRTILSRLKNSKEDLL